MRKWLLPGFHLLVTSRDVPDIRESLNPAGNEEVILKNAEINQDISDFISGQLNTDCKLRKWRAHHDRIQQVLAERAQGVYVIGNCISIHDSGVCPYIKSLESGLTPFTFQTKQHWVIHVLRKVWCRSFQYDLFPLPL
jgi:hypothetical protein